MGQFIYIDEDRSEKFQQRPGGGNPYFFSLIGVASHFAKTNQKTAAKRSAQSDDCRIYWKSDTRISVYASRNAHQQFDGGDAQLAHTSIYIHRWIALS